MARSFHPRAESALLSQSAYTKWRHRTQGTELGEALVEVHIAINTTVDLGKVPPLAANEIIGFASALQFNNTLIHLK